MTSSTKPVSWSTNLTLVQVRPPSLVLNTPRSLFGPQRLAERRDVHDVGIDRIDDDATDVVRVAQAQMRPRAPAVERLVDAIAERRALTVVGLARADPDDVRIRGRHRDVADRRDALAIEERRPGRAGVGRFPQPARRMARRRSSTPCAVHLDVIDAAAHDGRTDRAPPKLARAPPRPAAARAAPRRPARRVKPRTAEGGRVACVAWDPRSPDCKWSAAAR